MPRTSRRPKTVAAGPSRTEAGASGPGLGRTPGGTPQDARGRWRNLALRPFGVPPTETRTQGITPKKLVSLSWFFRTATSWDGAPVRHGLTPGPPGVRATDRRRPREDPAIAGPIQQRVGGAPIQLDPQDRVGFSAPRRAGRAWQEAPWPAANRQGVSPPPRPPRRRRPPSYFGGAAVTKPAAMRSHGPSAVLGDPTALHRPRWNRRPPCGPGGSPRSSCSLHDLER